MPEKLVQAAIITFLLHLIVGLNPNTTVQTKATVSLPETPATIISSLFASMR
ncbi:hypothetical protein H6G41_02105 [Tolypothrix sp. FACHB-123]|uniref:hypothetical protein n=1 Tax=Tolypothrix sp. FACHB-123 TaxID=2692868 RepID=UPI0016855AD5|nr:hypothetical protein [Tolypothrix sp. FACHB-123]MBD2353426.1 hypothetical protein [Tolypothrix sp. FACHB-123]